MATIGYSELSSRASIYELLGMAKDTWFKLED
jgi:hypothetical protein